MDAGQFHLSLIVPSQQLHTTGRARLEDDQKKSETSRPTKRKAAENAGNLIAHYVDRVDEGDDTDDYSEY